MKLLLPIFVAAATTVCAAQQETLYEIASTTPAVSTLAAAIDLLELEALFSDPMASLTVFAPTNDAFTAVAGFPKFLEDPWEAHLLGILQYHIIEGAVTSDMLTEGLIVPTVEGSNITVTLAPVQVNGVDVVGPDILATNGVVHVIDQVLVPPFLLTDLVEVLLPLDSFSTLVSLLVAAELVDTLKLEGPYTVFAPTNEAVRSKCGLLLRISCFVCLTWFLLCCSLPSWTMPPLPFFWTPPT
jgi:transforming growth factor-beta-induced protein